MSAWHDDVVDDGIWGPKTQRHWEQLTSAQREYIASRVAVNDGVNIFQIAARHRTTPVSGNARRAPAAQRKSPPVKVAMSALGARSSVGLMSRADCYALCDKYTATFGLPSGTLRRFLDLEVGSGPLDAMLDPATKGGSGGRYWGLMQFDDMGSAWATAAPHAKLKGINLGPFATSWYIAEKNIAAAGAYAWHHAKQIRRWKKTYPRMSVTWQSLYACHQQGSGWYLETMKKPREDRLQIAGIQSEKSKSVLKAAIA